MDAVAEALRHLVVDLGAKAGQAAERRLDVAARTAKPIVKVEMPERGIEVVDPHQPHHPPAQPDTFGVAGRAVDGLGGFRELVGLALAVLGRIGWGGPLFGLILGMGFAALGKCASKTEQEDEPGNREMAQDRKFWMKHPSTHKFPDFSSLLVALPPGSADAVQMGPECGEAPSHSDDRYFGICPATPQLYRRVVKSRGDAARALERILHVPPLGRRPARR